MVTCSNQTPNQKYEAKRHREMLTKPLHLKEVVALEQTAIIRSFSSVDINAKANESCEVKTVKSSVE